MYALSGSIDLRLQRTFYRTIHDLAIVGYSTVPRKHIGTLAKICFTHLDLIERGEFINLAFPPNQIPGQFRRPSAPCLPVEIVGVASLGAAAVDGRKAARRVRASS